MFTLRLAKQAFFDRAGVVAAMSAAERRVLSRFGAFVRQRARTSIRPRRSVSAPGNPPSSHVGLLKRFIWFAYDSQRHSVVIGPVRLTATTGGDAPRLLEYGGSAQRHRRGRMIRLHYQARPFMRPAFAQEQAQLPILWKNSIR
jgi:hypothetical protein